jgi:hypothetical protein
VSLPFNLGIGACIQTGFKIADRSNFDIAIQVDGDGQHIAAEVGSLLIPLLNNDADVVVGSRYIGAGGYRTPLARKIGSLVFASFLTVASGQRVTDATSGFRAYSRDALVFLANRYPPDYPEVEAMLALVRNGFRVTEVFVRMRAREHGRSSITAPRAVYYMVKVLLAITLTMLRKPLGGQE